ncbi:response regulator transcription factor [Spirochaeta cellobiosiphila]|uniref:response regulator transcription factor n=1 Tax=Spirochaeta cellobiosiphila TaxID=504483 RepID=UPI000405F36A|nr:helix-turn-helix transcriptional regulator [Spirochaeta cellobiosiphila]
MDSLFFLINGMAVFFGLGSLAFTVTLSVVTKSAKLRLYSFIQLLLILRHGLYIFKADIPVLDLPEGIINYLYLSDFCLILLLIYSVCFYLNRILSLNYKRQLLPLLIPFTVLYFYAGISSLGSWSTSAIGSFSPLVWIICGYGSLIYLGVLSLINLYKLKAEELRSLGKIASVIVIVFSVVMAVDDLYLFPSLNRYGFFSFPLFLLVWNVLSIVILVSLYLKPSEGRGIKLAKLADTYSLSAREKEIAEHLVSGLSYKEIGSCLNVSMGTVKTHVYNIYNKTGVSSKLELISKVRDWES